MESKPFDLLALGDDVFEIEPWCAMVHRRIIESMTETATPRLGAIKRTVVFHVDGALTRDNRTRFSPFCTRGFSETSLSTAVH